MLPQPPRVNDRKVQRHADRLVRRQGIPSAQGNLHARGKHLTFAVFLRKLILPVCVVKKTYRGLDHVVHREREKKQRYLLAKKGQIFLKAWYVHHNPVWVLKTLQNDTPVAISASPDVLQNQYRHAHSQTQTRHRQRTSVQNSLVTLGLQQKKRKGTDNSK
jgi:hypothetical protein